MFFWDDKVTVENIDEQPYKAADKWTFMTNLITYLD